ncbi:MAG TPA: VCBS repeat-containing protein [Planctomycetota bacterium]|nr:VCBS repeat-containing protein [Planctomycetota bacterium]
MSRQTVLALFATAIAAASCLAQAPRFGVVEESLPRDATFLGAFDEDADGDDDLLAPGATYRNDGTGRFAPFANALGAAVAPGMAAAFADFDGDGFRDVAVITSTGATAWYARPGGAVQGPATQWSPVYPNYVGFFGDFDDDGVLDLAVGAKSPANFAPLAVFTLLMGFGSTSTPTEVTVSVPAGHLVGQVWGAGELSGAGGDDLFVSAYVPGSSTVHRFVLSFDATAAPSYVQVPCPGDLPIVGAVVADFDGDGDADVATTSTPSPTLFAGGGAPFQDEVYTNAGALVAVVTPVPAAAKWVAASSAAGTRVWRYDFSGVDIRDMSGAAPAIVSGWSGHVQFVVPLDADGDGDQDALVGYQEGVRQLLFDAGSAGWWEERPDLFLPAAYISRYVVVDVDGDGDLDVLLPTFGVGCASSMQVAVNDGTGRFTRPTAGAPCGGAGLGAAFVAGDFDGDGDVDVFESANTVVQATPSIARLHLQGPPLTFNVVSIPNGMPGVPTRAVAVDDDADGDLDVYVAMLYHPPATGGVALTPGCVFRYVNAGGLTAWGSLVANMTASDLAVADVSGDGIPDVVAAAGITALGAPTQTPWGSTTIIEGGSLSTWTIAGAPPATAVDVVDVDGDGAREIVTFSPLGAAVYTGALIPSLIATTPGVPGAVYARFLHVDGDARPDMIFGDDVLLNTTTGPGATPAFTLAQTLPSNLLNGAPANVPQGYGSGDFDRDGDVDLIDARGRPLWNLSRHLARSAPPALGFSSGLEVRGAPADPWVLFAALGPATLDAGVWGLVRIAPATAVLVASGACDATGRSVVPFAVPNAPALAGLSLWWQAALPAQQRVTNVEVTTVLDL